VPGSSQVKLFITTNGNQRLRQGFTLTEVAASKPHLAYCVCIYPWVVYWVVYLPNPWVVFTHGLGLPDENHS